jgi:uncharacterized protein
MEKNIIGRKEEQVLLSKVLESKEAEMVAVIGRRRVGKTYLINKVFEDNMVFDITGTQNGTTQRQLQNFADQLEAYIRPFRTVNRPTNWQEAFKVLRHYLQDLLNEDIHTKKVLFFDELPWLAGQKSGFLEAFGYFWNSWASRQPALVVVICGSAASWMIQKVVNDRGGLHNRVTRRLFLEPFTLNETEAYLHSLDIVLDRYQLVQIYMAFGGIPHYLKEIEAGQSAVQNIDRICFSKQGILSDEFERLYPSLFADADNHIAVVRALASRKMGMTRNALAETAGLPNGGGLTKLLDELVQSGFVSFFSAFGNKKKEKIYRLTDEYSLFFLQFIEQNRYQGNNPWQHLSQTPNYKTWSGYAFEGVCLKHLAQIKHALGISGVYSLASSFSKKGTADEEGVQIDFVLERNDHIINLFEVKFYNQSFSLSKEYADKLQRTRNIFQEQSKTRKQLQWVFIASFGLTQNQHSVGLVARSLTLNDLFS